MIKYLLREVERSPAPAFSKKELVAISPMDFEDLCKKKILTYRKPREDEEERIRDPRCAYGCTLTVVPVENGYEAVCLVHPEEEPISVEKDSLARYSFSLDQFLKQIRAANRIEGRLQRIDGRFLYLGFKAFGNERVGFVFTSHIDDRKLLEFTGLRHLFPGEDSLVVLSPVTQVEEVTLEESLRTNNIIQVPLIPHLKLENFELPIEQFLSRLSKEQGEPQIVLPELSQKQRADYKKHEYQCYDRIHIPGTVPLRRSNVIVVNGSETNIGDAPFALLARLVLELKKKKGGWVNTINLRSEHLITEDGTYQSFGNLRHAVKGVTQDKQGQKLIQSDGSKNYRLSVHPDLVTYDKKKLLDHPDHRIGGIAAKLKAS